MPNIVGMSYEGDKIFNESTKNMIIQFEVFKLLPCKTRKDYRKKKYNVCEFGLSI